MAGGMDGAERGNRNDRFTETQLLQLSSNAELWQQWKLEVTGFSKVEYCWNTFPKCLLKINMHCTPDRHETKIY